MTADGPTGHGSSLGSGISPGVLETALFPDATVSDAESNRSSRLSAAWAAPASGADSSYSLRHQSSSWAAGFSPC
ncbi:hypothetical protein GTW64_05475 [Streptomyces sp. SID4923]|nr:hypothetical protein [Streptomyces sp. SID4923]